eukprot:Awhi_evm2s7813
MTITYPGNGVVNDVQVSSHIGSAEECRIACNANSQNCKGFLYQCQGTQYCPPHAKSGTCFFFSFVQAGALHEAVGEAIFTRDGLSCIEIA